MPSSGPYDLILADPPWQYAQDQVQGTVLNHYPPMPIADICALGVPAATDARLFLWATAPLLPEALAVIEAWGFTYKTCAVWDKQREGVGYWWRGQHELLLTAVKGNASPPAPELRRSSVWQCRRGPHSAKPWAVRDYLVAAFPDATRRLEMFARYEGELFPPEGWDVWGNQSGAAA